MNLNKKKPKIYEARTQAQRVFVGRRQLEITFGVNKNVSRF